MNYNKIFLEAWVVCLATNDYILVWIQKILKDGMVWYGILEFNVPLDTV